MTTLRKHLLIAAAVLGLAGTASAADSPAAGPAASHGQWAERAAARQQRLHDALHLTPSQESAWQAWLAAAARHEAGPRPDRGAWKTLSAPLRLEQQIARSRQHTERMEARLAALQPFYASLTPEQKKVFDAQRGQRRGHGHRGHHGMQHKGA